MSPRRRLSLLALACALALPAGASARVPDSFYSSAKSIPSTHGKLIKKVRIRGGSLPAGGRSYLVLYSSEAPSGKEVATSGIITLPNGKAPKGGWPVVSWAHGTTGIADACAPSKPAQSPPSNDYVKSFRAEAGGWVKRGWAVAQTDYQGLGTPGLHQYLIGEASGRSVIDIVLAARNLDKGVGKRWAAIGHSQGGHSTLWAAALAAKYAPGLKLTGAVPLAPASHIGEQAAILQKIETNPFGGLPALIVAGALDSGHIAPETIFSDAAMAFYPQIDEVCLDQLSQPSSFGGLGLKAHFREGIDTTPVTDIISANDPEDLTIKVPLLIAQGKSDTTVFPMYTDQTVADYESRGTKVTYKTYEGVTHTTVVQAARKDTDAFLTKLLG